MLIKFLHFLTLLISTQGLFHKQGLRDPPASGKPLPPEQWFLQRLDHFKASDLRTWKQRFWINWSYYKPGGPALIMIGGEGEANPAWLEAGSWVKYARDEGAAMLLLEHRYYGQSHPTEDMSVKNLVWLSSRQALADLANFITQMMEDKNLTGGWVALGGSYPGSLAAWLRLKYPHLVKGSVSTSAPLLAKDDFFEYIQVVEDSLNTVPGCADSVKQGMNRVQDMVKDSSLWHSLDEKFRLCSKFDGSNENDMINLFESLVGNFEGIVQYNKDNRAFEGFQWGNITIDTLCDMMTRNIGPSWIHETRVDQLALVNDLILLMSDQECLDHTYQSEVKSLRETGWESEAAAGGRQWTYQTCTEFGWYQSSDTPDQSWGSIIPVSFFEKMCQDVYGPKFTLDLLKRGIRATNVEYGGLDIQVSNVVFVHGSIDPWHAMGKIQSDNTNSPAIFIEGTAHCANMYPESDDDSPQLKEARKRVGQLIHHWLQN